MSRPGRELHPSRSIPVVQRGIGPSPWKSDNSMGRAGIIAFDACSGALARSDGGAKTCSDMAVPRWHPTRMIQVVKRAGSVSREMSMARARRQDSGPEVPGGVRRADPSDVPVSDGRGERPNMSGR
jgi:hypothetical protein